jgi:hypothetical protein
LKERFFREHLKITTGRSTKINLCINCSTGAIVPAWASILVAIQVAPYAKKTVDGVIEDLELLFMKNCWPKLIILSTPIKQL